MKKSLIAAGAASVALAAMPVLGVFADATDTATDTIEVTVSPSCTFTTGTADGEYAVSGDNGATVAPADSGSSSTHSFVVFCNQGSGYTVSAEATSLTKGTGQSAVTGFVYTATLPDSGTAGKWHATVQKPESSAVTIAQIADNGSTSNIATKGAASGEGGEAFSVTYSAYIGSETPAGTYTGSISYTLTPGA